MSNRKFALVMTTLFLSVSAWSAPTLTVGKVVGKAGTEAILPIAFDPGGAKVSAAQFSIVLPADLAGVSANLGTIGSSAGKAITAKQQGNRWNIIIMGMNQTPIDAGVLANATVKISSSAKPGKLPVSIDHMVYSDGAGKGISPGPSKAGSVKVSADAQ